MRNNPKMATIELNPEINTTCNYETKYNEIKLKLDELFIKYNIIVEQLKYPENKNNYVMYNKFKDLDIKIIEQEHILQNILELMAGDTTQVD
jgi:hypothetical protein